VWSRSRQFGTSAKVFERHFGTSAELSGHFGTSLMVPKCLGSEVSWVRSVLTPYTTTCCCLDKIVHVYQRMAKTANHVGHHCAVIIGPGPHLFHELQRSCFEQRSQIHTITRCSAHCTCSLCFVLNFLCIFTALHVMQTRSSDRNSVCSSVCHTRALWENGRNIGPYFYIIRKII